MRIFLISLVTLLVASCSSRSNTFTTLKIPSVIELESTSILELEKHNTIRFGGYGGFYIITDDTLFKRIFLITEDEDQIKSTETSEKQIQNFRNKKVENLSSRYFLSDAGQKQKVESLLRKRFEKFL